MYGTVRIHNHQHPGHWKVTSRTTFYMWLERPIHMMIKDYGYSVGDVFATGRGWSSTYVNVYPIYP